MNKNIFLSLDKNYVSKLFENKKGGYFPDAGKNAIKEIIIEKKSPEWAEETCLARYQIIFDNGETKILRGSGGLGTLKRNAWRTSAFLSKRGLALAKPTDFIEEIGLFLYEEIEGLPLAALLADNYDHKAITGHLNDTALWLAKLHSISQDDNNFPPALCISNKELKDAFDKIGQSAPALRNLWPSEKQLNLIDEIGSEKNILIHNDFFPGNIIISSGMVFAIDFDKSGLGFPLTDVAQFLLWLEMSKKIWQINIKENKILSYQKIFLSAYFKAINMDLEQERKKLSRFLAKSCLDQAYHFINIYLKGQGKLSKHNKEWHKKTIRNFLKQALIYLSFK